MVTSTFGDARYKPMAAPQPGSEDFSRVIAEVPGCYMMLGARIGDVPSVPDNHSPRVQFDESVMADGTLLHALLAMRALERDRTRDQGTIGSGSAT